jgi:tRNA nucleotidyltransferase (CCA-adding enzyme)
MQYLHAYGALTGDEISIVLGLLDGILGRGEPFNLGMLALRGEDLIAAGFDPGPQLGRAMGSLLDYAIENPGENNKEALLSHLKDIN